MSVFTPLDRSTLEIFLTPYQLGRLLDFQGVEQGSENSNFFVRLEQADCVLTLIERGSLSSVNFVIRLLERLQAAALPAIPRVLATHRGEKLRRLQGRPALLQSRLSGSHQLSPVPQHCTEIGAWLAQLHRATQVHCLERPSDRGYSWMLQQGNALLGQALPSARKLLKSVLAELAIKRACFESLPQANLHGDLFRDNALFIGSQLSGVIDFHNACSGAMLYDIAIVVNDWCSLTSGELEAARTNALLSAYGAHRRFTASEAECWPAMLRTACLRFWLSRFLAARALTGKKVLIHDPLQFEQRLSARQQVLSALPLE